MIDLNLSKAASYTYLCHSLKWSANFPGYLFPRSLALRVIVYSVTEWKVLRIKWCQTSIVSEIFWDLSCRLKVNYKNSFKALIYGQVYRIKIHSMIGFKFSVTYPLCIETQCDTSSITIDRKINPERWFT